MVNRNNFAERFLFSNQSSLKRWLCNVGQNLRVGSEAMTMSMKTETGGTVVHNCQTISAVCNQ